MFGIFDNIIQEIFFVYKVVFEYLGNIFNWGIVFNFFSNYYLIENFILSEMILFFFIMVLPFLICFIISS